MPWIGSYPNSAAHTAKLGAHMRTSSTIRPSSPMHTPHRIDHSKSRGWRGIVPSLFPLRCLMASESPHDRPQNHRTGVPYVLHISGPVHCGLGLIQSRLRIQPSQAHAGEHLRLFLPRRPRLLRPRQALEVRRQRAYEQQRDLRR